MILDGWKFKKWPEGEIAIQRIENRNVVEWFGPWSANELADLIQELAHYKAQTVIKELREESLIRHGQP